MQVVALKIIIIFNYGIAGTITPINSGFLGTIPFIGILSARNAWILTVGKPVMAPIFNCLSAMLQRLNTGLMMNRPSKFAPK